MDRLDLNEYWQLRSEELSVGPKWHAAISLKKEDWLDCSLPCDVRMPLIEGGIIRDPVVADYSNESEWIENKSWWFLKAFYITSDQLEADSLELHLESLDSEADIFLNQVELGHHRSAFYPFTADVKSYLKEGENQLLIRLTSGLENYTAQDLASAHGTVSTEKKQNRGERGDERRAMVRKPQYAYGWDWGPRVATCGIMKGAYLLIEKSVSIGKLHAVTLQTEPKVLVRLEAELENLHPFSEKEGVMALALFHGNDQVLEVRRELVLKSGLNFVSETVEIPNARLWWPNGWGEQPLYHARLTLRDEKGAQSQAECRFGIRTLRLCREPLNPKERSFFIEVNGVPIFCKGANWIPADSLYARVSDEKYTTLVEEAQRAHFNMLRIWGGGLYERDVFYDRCDEKGILIWHDFMFACAMYPDHLEWFQREVEKEMDYQTRRLRNHPSVALWCGNNEIHWGFDEWWKGLSRGLSLGGAFVWNTLAPRIIHNNCPETPYWNSSPYGGEHPNSSVAGDRHHWGDCTMNPDMEKRITPEEYDKVTAKFVSEYGYVGPCKKSSVLRYYGSDGVDRKSLIWSLHNNTFEKDTVNAGISKHYLPSEDLALDNYLLYAGLCQGLMYGYSLEALRFKTGCGGALFWMYSDCWGEVGWTILDYYLTRKIAYPFVKRAFEPVKLILREVDEKIVAMGINDTPNTVAFEAECGYLTFDGTRKLAKTIALELKPHSREPVLRFEKKPEDYKKGCLFVRPLDNSQQVKPAILRTGVFRELDLPQARLSVYGFRLEEGKGEFIVEAQSYAHGVHFKCEDVVRFSDEYFDLLPGEKRYVQMELPEGASPPDTVKAYAINNVLYK